MEEEERRTEHAGKKRIDKGTGEEKRTSRSIINFEGFVETIASRRTK
jgi:hypothetical protein